jgi:hypothetical protein
VNNYLNILAMTEKDMQRVVFVRGQDEGGINAIYDPERGQESFQVFIHKSLPYRHLSSWDFETFGAARNFAAKEFVGEWELFSWDFKTRRPCEEGGRECGSGECETCKSIKAEGGEPSGCGTETGKGSCGCA